MTSMTTIASTDFKYETIDYTIGMASGRFFTCNKVDDFEQRAVKDPLFESIPDDKPIKFYFDCDHKFPIEGIWEDMGADMLGDLAKCTIKLNIQYITAMFALHSSTIIPDIRYAESHYEHRLIKGVDHWGLSFHIVVPNICATKSTIGDFARKLNAYVAQDQMLNTPEIGGYKYTDNLPSFVEAVDTKVKAPNT
jgi:hypothetical protein